MSHQEGRNPFSAHTTGSSRDVFSHSSLYQGNPLYRPQDDATSQSAYKFGVEANLAVEQSVAAIFNEVTDAITHSLKYDSWDEATQEDLTEAQIKDGQSLR